MYYDIILLFFLVLKGRKKYIYKYNILVYTIFRILFFGNERKMFFSRREKEIAS